MNGPRPKLMLQRSSHRIDVFDALLGPALNLIRSAFDDGLPEDAGRRAGVGGPEEHFIGRAFPH